MELKEKILGLGFNYDNLTKEKIEILRHTINIFEKEITKLTLENNILKKSYEKINHLIKMREADIERFNKIDDVLIRTRLILETRKVIKNLKLCLKE